MLKFFPINDSEKDIKRISHPSFDTIIDSQSCQSSIYYLNNTSTLFSATFTPSKILQRQTIIAQDVKEFTVQPSFLAIIFQDGRIKVQNKYYNYSAPRGLNSTPDYIIFSSESNNFHYLAYSPANQEFSESISSLSGQTIIDICIFKNQIFILSGHGYLYHAKVSHNNKISFEKLSISDFLVLKMICSSTSLFLQVYTNQFYQVKLNPDDQSQPFITFHKCPDHPFDIHSLSIFPNSNNTNNNDSNNVNNNDNENIETSDKNVVYLSTLGALSSSFFSNNSNISPNDLINVSYFILFQNFLVTFSGSVISKALPFTMQNGIPNFPPQCTLTLNNIYKFYAFDSFTVYSNFSDPKLKPSLQSEELSIDTHARSITPYITMDDFAKLYSKYGTINDETKQPVYLTNNYKFVELDTKINSFCYNLLPGDIIETPNNIQAVFIGVSTFETYSNNFGNLNQNSNEKNICIWLKPQKSNFVYTYSEPLALNLIERPGHILHNVEIDGNPAIIDITPDFCQNFLCKARIGDLLWIPLHGVVEFVGAYKAFPVFKDFSNNTLFTSRDVLYEIVRAFKTDLSSYFPKTHNPKVASETLEEGNDRVVTRRVKTIDDEIITLDVTADNRIFMPTDRVQTPDGEATLIGYGVSDGRPYVLTDADYLSQNGVRSYDIFDLSLIRRIGIEATVNGHDVSTKHRYNGAMAGDIVQSQGNSYIVRYVTNNGLYCKRRYYSSLNSDNISEDIENSEQNSETKNQSGFEKKKELVLIRDFEIVYRADILSNEQTEVGSPVFSLSCLVPGDKVVTQLRGEEMTFKGLSKGGPLFLVEGTRDIYITSYTPLIMSDVFVPIKRVSFYENK